MSHEGKVTADHIAAPQPEPGQQPQDGAIAAPRGPGRIARIDDPLHGVRGDVPRQRGAPPTRHWEDGRVQPRAAAPGDGEVPQEPAGDLRHVAGRGGAMATGHRVHGRPHRARLVARGVVAETPPERAGYRPVPAQGRLRAAALRPHPLAEPDDQRRWRDGRGRDRHDPSGAQVAHEDPGARPGDAVEPGAVPGAPASGQMRQECPHGALVQRAEGDALRRRPQTEMHGVRDAPLTDQPAVAELLQRHGEPVEVRPDETGSRSGDPPRRLQIALQHVPSSVHRPGPFPAPRKDIGLC